MSRIYDLSKYTDLCPETSKGENCMKNSYHNVADTTFQNIRIRICNHQHCCGSGMFIPDPNFSIADPNFFRPRSRIRIIKFEYFRPKKILSVLFILDPDPDFLPIPYPGFRVQKGTGSRIRIRNTANSYHNVAEPAFSKRPDLYPDSSKGATFCNAF